MGIPLRVYQRVQVEIGQMGTPLRVYQRVQVEIGQMGSKVILIMI